MGKRSPAAPPAPDPRATAQAQSEFNVQAARTNASLNRVNQFTPQGSLTYRQAANEGPSLDEMQTQAVAENAGNPDFNVSQWRESAQRQNADRGDRWEAVTTFSPEQQRLYDLSTQAQTTYGEAANSQLSQARQALSSPFAFNAPGMQFDTQDRTGGMSFRPDFTGIGDPNQSREAVQEALMARINPDIERERAALENRLANQGITMGSEAWNTGMQDQARMANDARFGAILNAGQEQSRMFGLGMSQAGFNNAARQQAFGMDMGRAQFGNQARQQSLQEQLAMRAQPVNEASALLTGGQVQMPQFQNVPQVQVQAPDYAGAVGQNYAGAMQQWNARNQQNAQTSGQMGQLAGSAMMASAMAFSDRRLKKNVEMIGRANGLPVYRFDYIWNEPGVGHMADEVAEVAPWAVSYGADGFARVDYGAIA